MKHTLFLTMCALLLLSCADSGLGPADRHFNLLLRYGVGARNELNTFNDTFTKDLLLDGTATTRLVLAQSDFDTIESRLQSIGIFSYPDTFVALHGDTVAGIEPHATYDLVVTLDSKAKRLFWEDAIISADPRATQLRQAFEFVRAIIDLKPEYRRLPPARGGYL